MLQVIMDEIAKCMYCFYCSQMQLSCPFYYGNNAAAQSI
jgi:Fe-S oxidoreductase